MYIYLGMLGFDKKKFWRKQFI